MKMRHGRGRLFWLTDLLSVKRIRLSNLFGRLGDLGPRETIKPNLLKKFLCLLDQIAIEHDEEVRLLSEIEAVENKHRSMKKHGKLKHAEICTNELALANTHEAERPKRNLFWFFALLVLMTGHNKKQRLTAD